MLEYTFAALGVPTKVSGRRFLAVASWNACNAVKILSQITAAIKPGSFPGIKQEYELHDWSGALRENHAEPGGQANCGA